MGRITEQWRCIIVNEARLDDHWYHRMVRLMAVMTMQQIFRGRRGERERS